MSLFGWSRRLKIVLLLSESEHAPSKGNVEGEEVLHSSPQSATIPSARDPPSRTKGASHLLKQPLGICNNHKY